MATNSSEMPRIYQCLKCAAFHKETANGCPECGYRFSRVLSNEEIRQEFGEKSA